MEEEEEGEEKGQRSKKKGRERQNITRKQERPSGRRERKEALHHAVCQSHCRLPIDQQDGPPLQTGLVLFTEPCLVRPGKKPPARKNF